MATHGEVLMAPNRHVDGVQQRRRAAALARHYRDQEALLIRRDRPTVGAARSRPQGISVGSNRQEGACSQVALPGDLPVLVERPRPPGKARVTPMSTANAAMGRTAGGAHAVGCARRCRTGRFATAACRRRPDWSRTHAKRRGGEALTRLADGDWPAAMSTVIDLYDSWADAVSDAQIAG